MPIDPDSLQELQKLVREFSVERDWDQYHSPRNLAMAISVEAAELLELFLWSTDNGPQPPLDSRKPSVADEAADVLICLLNFCHHANVDLGPALVRKLDKAREKYPVQSAKGRFEKYSELDVPSNE